MTLAEVRINTNQEKASDGHTIRIYDIWTEGEHTAGDFEADKSDQLNISESIGGNLKVGIDVFE